ncbi:uncharacterized protein LOC136041239 [Artemia franciscana]|uniref:Protein pinocchio n=1 Tax=Artemia franciscana TaxID=6661 RepID=A0AA88HAZ0_ARTSF|nr:hypothetical protein QYM36_017570 [Artemia franciscana]KAK2704121.1 hypothetical protein QYM36_017570 [Artemia franciscana]KAK2704122.1 hypothetical protein QYM36_017570 [Artemia franciscana]
MSLTEIPRTPSVTSSKASLLFDFDLNDPDFGSLKDLPQSCFAAHKFAEEAGLRKVKTCPVALGTLSESIENILHLGRQRSRNASSNACSTPDDANLVGNLITLEDLRTQFSSCFSCGVNWQENQMSLDCGECGGYTVDRPCPACEGKCGASWKRDATSSHCLGKASWTGECMLDSKASLSDVSSSKPPKMSGL